MVDETYEKWNQAFIAEYFPNGNAGRLAWLPVDDDEIRALADTYSLAAPGRAVEEFTAVIKRWLATKGGSFTRFSSGVDGWRRVRDTPPYVAGLAFCVFAASRMAGETSARIASTNYYTQLNRLLGRDDRAGQPPGFDTLEASWCDFTRWLDVDCEGRRGLSTFRNANAGRYVGYPLSQALLRACDRRRLPDFFRSAGLDQQSEISSGRIFSLLRAWAGMPSCGLTTRARTAIASAKDIDLHEIAETVLRELRAWDGELRDARGRRRAPIHLLVIPRRRGAVVRLLARKPDDFEAGPWQADGSAQQLLLAPHPTADGWFAPLEVEVSAKILQQGYSLTRGELALTFDAADAIPCREAAPEIGGYISQPQATMFEPHLAVVKRALIPRLKDYLSSYADSRLELSASPPGFPAEWAVTSRFRFVSRPGTAPAEFGRLAPRLIATTSISGGLALSTGVYLTGGEPDVNIATAEGSPLVPELDGIAQPMDGGALTLRLSEMRLEPGEHELAADVTRRFSTRDTLGDVEPPAAGTLGFRLSRHSSYQPEATLAEALDGVPPAGWIHLSGAVARGASSDLPLPDRRPILTAAGARQYVLLGRCGHVDWTYKPVSPEWLKPLGLADVCQFIELEPDFEPVWLLRESSTRSREVLPLLTDPPRPAVDEPPVRWAEALGRWSEAVVAEEVKPVWEDYLAAALRGAAA